MVMKKFVKAVLFIFSVILVLSPLGACTKDGDTGTKTTAASGTAVKTVAATTAKAAATSAAATSKVASSGTAAAAATTAGTGAEQVAETGDGGTGAGTDESDEDDFAGDYDPEEGIAKSENIAERVVFDLKGRKIIYATASPSYTFDYFSKLNPEFITLTKRIEYLQGLYNCKIELMPYPGWTQIQTALMTNCIAGTYWADGMMFVGSWTMKFHEFIQPLNDYIDFSDPKKLSNPGQTQLNWDGKYYSVLQQYKVAYEENIAYNRDIFGREGLNDLMELQRSGQWTWNVMLDFAVKATRDFDGDGIIDQWGLVRDSIQGVQGVVKAMVKSNDGRIIDNSSGDYRLAISDARALKALYFLNDLQNVYKTGTIYSASTAFKLGKAAMSFSNLAESRKTRDDYPDGAAIVLYPKGPDTDKYIILNPTAGGWSGAMPYFVDEPEKIAQVIYGLCAVYDDTYPDYVPDPDIKTAFSTYIFSDYDYETLELQKSIIQSEGALMDPYAYLTSDLDSVLLSGNNSLFYNIMQNNVPVQSAIDTVRDTVSDKIRTLVETYRRIR